MAIYIEAISAAFIGQENRFLMVQRAFDRSYGRLLWELMGGDIPVGLSPRDALIKDALEKLNIPILETKFRGIHFNEADMTKRYIFQCRGDYENFRLNSKKYDQFRWCTQADLRELRLGPGVEEILEKALT